MVITAMAASAIAVFGLGISSAAETPAPDQAQVGPVAPQDFLGTWRDGQDRFWFTIEQIDGIEVRAARFWLASLKEGRIEGDTLTLTSRSCVPIIGCYEYTHVAKMVAPGELDMTGTSENCRFWHECKEGIDEVNQTLTRQ
jgi:hypothetical protein